MKTVIHWFRRDLRCSDNTALHLASSQAGQVVPVFIVEEALRTGPDVGAARLAFLLQSVESLRLDLLALGYELVVRSGRSEEEIPRLAAELRAEAVFCNRRPEPYAQARDERVAQALAPLGVGFHSCKDAVAWEKGELLNQAGKPYTVFTPYSRTWKSRLSPKPFPALAPARKKAPVLRNRGPSLALEAKAFGHSLTQSIPRAGETAARELWQGFKGLPRYAQTRDFPALEGTSRLSPHLRCGSIGVRQLYADLAQALERGDSTARVSLETFRTELIWREFYIQVLAHFPHVMSGCFRSDYDRLTWENDPGYFQAWCEGRTGYPIIDAAMRCLNATGWMHNRLRMIVAMFLTKDLLIHWQWGERYFMQQLVDGDLAANNGGWQWCAGTGTDAAPYFRIFNPVTQGEKCDPQGTFVRQWVPELHSVPDRWIHQPWNAPQGKAATYPERIVHHESRRERCLAMFQEVRSKPA